MRVEPIDPAQAGEFERIEPPSRTEARPLSVKRAYHGRMDISAQTIAAIGVGLGLAAACGFRVFVPLLVLSLAAKWGYVPLAPGWTWIGTSPAVIAFGTATLLEAFGYFIPWVDHALDLVATPAAVLAGMVTTASVLTDLPPLVRWAAIIVGGGGLAALVQSSTVALRAGSTATTGGLANPLIAAAELGGSAFTALLAVLLPLVALLAVVLGVALFWRVAHTIARRRRRRVA